MRTPLSVLLLLCLLFFGACRCQPAPPPGEPTTEVTEAGPTPTFIEDDYPRALALAQERGLPLFIDTWAPWCHSCLSMKRTVLRDPRLAPMTDRFVWLSLNTEREESASFLERHPQQVWPTLTILDPKSEDAILRWRGAPTVGELLQLLDDSLRAVAAGLEGPDALLAQADRLHANGEEGEAAALLQEALAKAPADWAGRPRAVINLLGTLRYNLRDIEGCAALALRELPALARSASKAKVATLGLRCAADLPPSPARDEAMEPLEASVREALAPPEIEMSADDRSNLYDLLTNLRSRAGDQEGAKALATEWLAFLEEAAAEAPDEDVRAIFDSHRLLASLRLDTPERVVQALQQSERAHPEDYNPPARLAVVYHRLGELDEALAASDRALAKAYGPRKVRLLNERGDILLSREEPDEARAAFGAALEAAAQLPASQRPARELNRAKDGLSALGG